MIRSIASSQHFKAHADSDEGMQPSPAIGGKVDFQANARLMVFNLPVFSMCLHT